MILLYLVILAVLGLYLLLLNELIVMFVKLSGGDLE